MKKKNDEEGHFQLALPWRRQPPDLPNDKSMVERRLQLLKKRLLKDEELYEKYRKTMQEYIDQGHAEKVPVEELEVKDRPLWYLPHHTVTHPLKPGKVRVVFDCAAKFEGVSLNDELMQGPDVANSVVGVLIRFRQEHVAVVADIEGMFHQVRVDPNDCDALRFLWWPNGNLQAEPEEYRMKKHIFGATSSPSCANFCLKKTATLNQADFDTKTVRTVDKNMYVDDLMRSVNTTDLAIRSVNQLREILAKGGFRLRKWLSNDRKVLEEIPESDRADSLKNLDSENLPTGNALGLKWDAETDKSVWFDFGKTIELVEKPTTRRTILSIAYFLFDPPDFVVPFVMKAKLLMQTLCRIKLGWDNVLDEQHKAQWLRWIEDLPKLQEIQINRCFKPENFGEVRDAQLHCFSDGSRAGYGAVVYLRLVDDRKKIHCAFVIGKACLASIREITIPRLELSAALISSKLSKMVCEELEYKLNATVYWTDSTSVLKCLNNETKRFHTFESNRLTAIREHTSPSHWRYVPSKDNPADDASKGMKIEPLFQNGRWMNGLEFLGKEENHWPQMITVPQMKDNDPEVRKETCAYTTATTDDVLGSLIENYSTWWKLLRAIAWLIRFKNFLRNKSTSNEHLSVSEIQEAERVIVQHIQKTSFPKSYQIIESRENGKLIRPVNLKKESTIWRLNPKMKNGVMVVGGRLANASVEENAKHSRILPKKHHVTNLVVESTMIGLDTWDIAQCLHLLS